MPRRRPERPLSRRGQFGTWLRDMPPADKLARMIGKKEPEKRRELVARQLRVLADDLEELWKAATRDPAAERRKQRGWILLTGALGAASTMASRKVMTKLWPILTGEPVPSVAPPSSPPSAREPEREAEAEPQQVPQVP